MPMDRAACWSFAVARIDTPVRVYLKISRKTTVPMTANTNPHHSPEGTTAKPRLRGSGGKISGKFRKVGVQIMYMIPLRITPNPIVTMITEMMGSPINGRSMRRSTRIPSTTANPSVRTKAK